MKCRKHKNYLDTSGRNRRRRRYLSEEERVENKRIINAAYYARYRDHILERNRSWREANTDRVRNIYNNWINNNPNYRVDRYRNNLQCRLSCILRSRLGKAIKNQQKVGSAVEDLGCSIDALIGFLEDKFQEGMSWDNYGEWHIDHVMPLSSFNLTNPNELKKACHYTNLQPLWSTDNLRKSNKVNCIDNI